MSDEAKALVKEMKAHRKEDHIRHEMSAYDPLDHWWGVPGISKPLGMPEDLEDDSLESLARAYRRGLEDVRDGLAKRAAPDLSVAEVEKNLSEIERWQGIRDALRYSYGASERGTNERLEFYDAGGLRMLREASRAGQEPLIRPSYKLAMFVDFTRWLEGVLTVFDWSGSAPKGDPVARWAKEAWGWEKAANYAELDIELGLWQERVGYYAWMGLEDS